MRWKASEELVSPQEKASIDFPNQTSTFKLITQFFWRLMVSELPPIELKMFLESACLHFLNWIKENTTEKAGI